MSILTLVRHGQATAFQKDSDRLSELGELQARRLGEFWLSRGVRADEVYTGNLVRQTSTERLVAARFHDSGTPWPMAVPLAGFDEYDATGVLRYLVPRMAERDQRFAGMVKAFESAQDASGQNRAFQRMFEIAMRVWLNGELDAAGVEPFAEFQARVRDALRRVMGGAGNRRVVVFTSGGPIGLSVQTAMEAPDHKFLDVNWRLRNASLTEFVFSGGRFTLDSFNAAPHLEDAVLWTYR